MKKYQPTDFKWRHFHGEVIMQCVRWYCKYGVSYRDLEEMMAERGLTIDHTTVYRWVQHYAPELKKRLDWYKRRYARRWHLDETYIKIKGEWKYLYRAIDEQGNTIDFYLSHRRNAIAAKRFLKKLIKSNPTCDVSVINTDKNSTYNQAIKELKKEGHLSHDVSHLQIKSHMSPYMTEQLKRFGEYVLDLGRRPANIHITRDKLLFKAQGVALKDAA